MQYRADFLHLIPCGPVPPFPFSPPLLTAPLLPRIFWVYSISNVLLHYYQGPTPYKCDQTKRRKPYSRPSSLLAEALSIWTAATFQNDIFSAVIIIVIRKWLIRWRPETNFKGTRGPEQGHAAVQGILSPALRKTALTELTHKTRPQIIKLLSGLATSFMLKICGMPFFA